MNGPWTEAGATLNTAPPIGSLLYSNVTLTTDMFVTLDLTSVVQGWFSSPGTNFGIEIVPSVATPSLVATLTAKKIFRPAIRPRSR